MRRKNVIVRNLPEPVEDKTDEDNTVRPRYNAVSGRHLLRPPYKRGAL